MRCSQACRRGISVGLAVAGLLAFPLSAGTVGETMPVAAPPLSPPRFFSRRTSPS